VTAAAAARQPRLSRTAVVLAALIIVVAGLAIATGVLAVRVLSSQAAQDARTASVAAARQKVPALLSYSYQTFPADLARAEADTTGQFRATYRKLMSGQVGPAAMASHVVTQVSVSGASVISAGPGNATLLLFLSEQTKTDAKQEPVLNDTAVRVTMREVNGSWLITGLVPRS
jgi:Mce-associated membrane protein